MHNFTKITLLLLFEFFLTFGLFAQEVNKKTHFKNSNHSHAHHACETGSSAFSIYSGGAKVNLTTKHASEYIWLETPEGEVLVNLDGEFYYAEEQKGKLVSSGVKYVYGKSYFRAIKNWVPKDNSMGQQGIGRPLNSSRSTVPSTGNINIPVFLMGFHDYQFKQNRVNGSTGTTYVNYDIISGDNSTYPLEGGDVVKAFNRLFNEGHIPVDNPTDGFMSAKEFYAKASYDKLNINFRLGTSSPRQAKKNALYYGEGNGENRTMDFVHEAIVASIKDGYGHPSQYDNDDDGFIEGVVVIHAGPGHTTAPGDVARNYIFPRRNSLEYNPNLEKNIVVVNGQSDVIDYSYFSNGQINYSRKPRIFDLEKRPEGGLRLKNGKNEQVWVFNDYAITSESQFWGLKDPNTGVQGQALVGIGNIVHEFGHLLGMPDIYVKEGYSVGKWDIMAGGAFASGQYFPTDFSAYTKMALGWITPRELYAEEDGETFKLAPSSQDEGNFYKLKTKYSQDYFLLENRTKDINGNDIAAPSEGMLIWHLFERLADVSNRFPTTLNGSAQFGFDAVDIEEADGIQSDDSEANDVWPGVLGKTEFGPNTVPSSRSNFNDEDTKITINNIKQIENGTIEFTLGHKEEEAPEPSYCQNKAFRGEELGITQVTFGQLNHSSPWNQTYHYDPLEVATVAMNQELELEVFVNGMITQKNRDEPTKVGVKAYIDWNGDGEFTEETETVLADTSILKDKKRFSKKIKVPGGIAHGSLRYLRVVAYALNYDYNAGDSIYTLDDIKPCASETFFIEGENEDYRIKFVDESIIDIPDYPTGLKAVSVKGEPEKVKLSWTDNSIEETSFHIFAIDHTGLNYEKIAEVSTDQEEIILENLLPLHKYFFRVQAIAEPISSALSDPVEITTPASTPKNFYWVENGGDWTDLSHWATSSGGIEKYKRMPSKSDNIIFDENSFTKQQQSIVFSDNIEIANLNMLKVTNRPEFTVKDPNLSITVYGDFKLPKGVFGYWGNLYLKSINTIENPSELLFESDEIFYEKVYFDAPEATGAWKLTGDFYGNIALLNQGILSFGNHEMKMIEKFKVADTPKPKTLNLDDGKLEIGSWDLPSSLYGGHLDAFTFTQKNSTLTISTAEINTSNGVYQLGSSFSSGDFEYNRLAFKTSDLRLAQEEPKFITVNSAVKVKEIKFHPGARVQFVEDTISFERIIADGIASKPIVIKRRENGTESAIFKNRSEEQPLVKYVHIERIKAVGSQCFRAENSINLDGSIGWCSLLDRNKLEVYEKAYSDDIYVGDVISDIQDYLFEQDPYTWTGSVKYEIIEGAEFADLDGRRLTAKAPGLVRLSVYGVSDGFRGDSEPYNDLYVVILDRNQPNKFVSFMQAVNVIGDDNFSYADNQYPRGPDPSQSKTPIPTAVKISSRGLVAVASQNANRVMIWTQGPGIKNNHASLGDADYVLGQKSFTENQIPSRFDYGTYANSPGNIAFSPDGNMLAIADEGASRVLIYKDIYATMAKADQRKANGEAPYITVEDADLVLGRSSFGLPQDYSIDKYPTGARTFNIPKGMAFTDDGKFILCDQSNNRVLIWNKVPESHFAAANIVIGQPDMKSNKAETSETGLNGPSSVSVSRDGKMIIADAANHRVLIYNRVPTENGAKADLVLGQKSFRITESKMSNRDFSWPYGVAVDSENRLAISEYGHSRVVIYNEIPSTNYAPADVVLGQPSFLKKYEHEEIQNAGLSYKEEFQKRILIQPFQPDFDAAGRLYVAGWNASQVKVFGAEANKGDLKVEISSSLKKPQLGDIFDVKINFEHKGGYDAHHVKIDYTLPAGLELVENPVPSVGKYDSVNNQWRIDQISASQRAEMNLKVTLKGEFQNEEVCMYSTIHSNLLDTNPDDNSSFYCLNKKKTVQITPKPIPTKKYGDLMFSADVTVVPEGLPIKYNLVFPGEPTAKIEGNRITILKPGSFTVEYIFEGDEEYKAKTVSELVAVDKATLDFALNVPVLGATYKTGVDYQLEFDYFVELPDEFADMELEFLPYLSTDGEVPAPGVDYDPQTKIMRFTQENDWLSLKFIIDEAKYAELGEYYDLRLSRHTVSFIISNAVSTDTYRSFKFVDPKPVGPFESFDPIELTLRPRELYIDYNDTITGIYLQAVVDNNIVKYELLSGLATGYFTDNGTYQEHIDNIELIADYDSDKQENVHYREGSADYDIQIPKQFFVPTSPGKFRIKASIPEAYTPWESYYDRDGNPILNKKTFRQKDTIITFEVTRDKLDTIAKITEFKIPTYQVGEEVIDQAAGTITINVSSEFTGKFTPMVDYRGNELEPSKGLEVDASQSKPVFYVTAQNDDHVKRYEIIINRELSSRTIPEYFDIEGLIIKDFTSGENNEISVVVPQTVNLDSVNIIVGIPRELSKVMKVSPNRDGRYDFSDGFKEFIIIAEDSTTEAYKVFVTHEQPDAAKISSAKLNGSDVFIAGNQMSVTFPAGTNISTLELSDVLWKVPSENPRITKLTEIAGKYSITLDAGNQALVSTEAENGETLDYTLSVDVEALPGVSTLKTFKIKNEVSNVIDHATNTINVEVPISIPDMTRILLESVTPDDINASLELRIDDVLQSNTFPKIIDATKSISLKVIPTNGETAKTYSVNISKQSNRLPANLTVTSDSPMLFTFGDVAKQLTFSKDTDADIRLVSGTNFDSNIISYDASTGLVTPRGVGNTTISFFTAESNTHKRGNVSVSVKVKEATYTLVTNPSATAIEVGQQVGTSTLSGGSVEDVNGAVVSGSFVFVNPSEVATVQGPKTVFVKFVPATANGNYLEFTSRVDVQVNAKTKVNPVVTFPSLSDITYGTALGNNLLKDGDDNGIAGSFEIDASQDGSVLDAGTKPVKVWFVADDLTTYNKVFANVNITINKAVYTLETSPSATAIEVGQQVGTSTLSGGSVKDVNDVLVSGSFVFVNPSEVATVQGPKTVFVKFVPETANGNYLEFTSRVDVQVNAKTKVNPVVTFPSLSDITYGTVLDNNLLSGGNDNGILGTFEIDASQDGSMLGAGTPSVKVWFVADDLTTYNKVFANVNITINKAVYTLETSPSATAIEVGQQVGVSALSGSVKDVNDAVVLGSFVFETPTEVATVEGPKMVSVKFVPTTADGNYLELRSTVTITVNAKTKVDPVVTFPSLSDITYGTALDNSLFENGNNNGILGSFEIDASQDGSILDAGTPSVKVWFKPTATETYNEVFENVNITINKAVYTLETNPSATAIEVGQQVGTSTLSGGLVKDVNGVAVLGSFVFETPTEVATAQEPKTVSVKFVPTTANGNYLELTSTVTITVNPKTKVDPIVTFPSLSNITYGTALGNNLLKDGDDNGIAGSFEIDASQDGSVLDAGTKPVKVWFVADDLTTYNKVFANVNITINKAVYTLETNPSVTAIEVGQQVGVSALSGGSVKDINDAVVLGSFEFVNLTELATAEGPKTVFVKFVPTTANGNYLEFTSRVDVQVNAKTKVNPVVTFPSLSDITYGTALGNNLLKDGDDNGIAGSFEIDASQDGSVLDAGTPSVKVWFKPTATDTYNEVFENVNITVNPATYTLVTNPTATAIEVGQQVGTSRLSGSVKDVSGVAVLGSFEFVNPTEEATVQESKTVSVKFVPTTVDGNYSELRLTVTITVNPKTKVDPIVTFPSLKAITYGAVLENNLLKDGNDNGIAGSFEIDASQDGSVLDAGTPSVKVWFKPTATETYNEVFENVNITINKAVYTLETTPSATAIEVGQQVGVSTLSGSVKDVNDAVVLGSFVFGTPTEVATLEGPKMVSVKFVPTTADGNYLELRSTVTITVNPKTKVNPIVTFPSLSPITYGTALDNNLLSGGNDNGILGTFEIDASQDGSMLDAGTQPVKVWFVADDLTTYNKVFANVNITVNKASYTDLKWPSATSIKEGEELSTSSLTASASDSKGSFAFVKPDLLLSKGTHQVEVEFSPRSSNYMKSKKFISIRVTDIYGLPVNTRIIKLDILSPTGDKKSVLVGEAEIDLTTKKITAKVAANVDLSNLNIKLQIKLKESGEVPLISPSESSSVDLSDLLKTITIYNGEESVSYDLYITQDSISEPVSLNIVTFKIGSFVGDINHETGKISVRVSTSTDITSVNPEIVSESKVVTLSPLANVVQDFTNPVDYTLSDGSSEKTYTVTVIKGNVLDAPSAVSLSLEAYPNPTTNYIKIKANHAKSNSLFIKVISLEGKVLQEKQVNKLTDTLDLSDLKSGIYFLSVSSGYEQTLTKIIKR